MSVRTKLPCERCIEVDVVVRAQHRPCVPVAGQPTLRHELAVGLVALGHQRIDQHVLGGGAQELGAGEDGVGGRLGDVASAKGAELGAAALLAQQAVVILHAVQGRGGAAAVRRMQQDASSVGGVLSLTAVSLRT